MEEARRYASGFQLHGVSAGCQGKAFIGITFDSGECSVSLPEESEVGIGEASREIGLSTFARSYMNKFRRTEGALVKQRRGSGKQRY